MSTCLVRSLRGLLVHEGTKPSTSGILDRLISSKGVLSGWLCQSSSHTLAPAHSRPFSGAAAGQATLTSAAKDCSSHIKHLNIRYAGTRLFHASAAAGAPNYYQTLGVPQSASEAEIKKSYYKLAKRYHPDANPENDDAVKKFQEVQEAYDILKDPQKRAMYDQVGHQRFKDSGAGDAGANAGGFSQGFPGGFPFQGGFSYSTGGGFGTHAMDDVLHDMAKEFFGGGGRRSSMYSSYQASTTVSISFMESLKGVKRMLNLHLGDGPEQQEVQVDVPAGIEHGSQLLMQDVIRTQQHRVSLVVQVQVQGDRRFVRKGDDIISKLDLKLTEALLGCQKEIETAWGPKTITVPQGTTSSSKIAIDAMGAPRLKGSGRGRHILDVSLKLPQRLTPDQVKVVEELRRSGL